MKRLSAIALWVALVLVSGKAVKMGPGDPSPIGHMGCSSNSQMASISGSDPRPKPGTLGNQR